MSEYTEAEKAALKAFGYDPSSGPAPDIEEEDENEDLFKSMGGPWWFVP
jgi:hypothetical protein